MEGTLHRISAMRDRHGSVNGLTYRIGRHVKGTTYVPCYHCTKQTPLQAALFPVHSKKRKVYTGRCRLQEALGRSITSCHLKGVKFGGEKGVCLSYFACLLYTRPLVLVLSTLSMKT